MLPFEDVNLMAVVGATIAAMALGMIYYGPLFGEQWMKLVGLTRKDASKDMGKTMALGLLSSFVMIYVIGLLLVMLSPADMKEAMHIGLALWAGFLLMNEAGNAIWAKGPWKLVWINGGYGLVFTLVSVAILMHWA